MKIGRLSTSIRIGKVPAAPAALAAAVDGLPPKPMEYHEWMGLWVNYNSAVYARNVKRRAALAVALRQNAKGVCRG